MFVRHCSLLHSRLAIIFLALTIASIIVNANPCSDPVFIAEASRQVTVLRIAQLYDGVAPLSKAPTRPITLPPEFATTPRCVQSIVQMRRAGDGWFAFEPPASVYRNRPQRSAQTTESLAFDIVREAMEQGALPAPAREGRYAVAVPLWRDHPLYASSVSGTGNAPTNSGRVARESQGANGMRTSDATLADRNLPNARLIKHTDAVDVYFVGESRVGAPHPQVWLAVVRRIARDEPLVHSVAFVNGPVTAQRYSGATRARFVEVLAPLLRPIPAPISNVIVWHYATGVHLPRVADSGAPIPPLPGGENAEPPVAIEQWMGQRRVLSEPFEWDGMSMPVFNTLATVQTDYEARAARVTQIAQQRGIDDARRAEEQRAREASTTTADAQRQRLQEAAGLLTAASIPATKLRTSGEVRAIFEGDFPGAPNQWEFGEAYFRTLYQYGQRCKSLIPESAAVSTFRLREVERRDGIESTTSEREVRTAIRPGFERPYKWRKDHDPLALVEDPSAFIRGLEGVITTDPKAAERARITMQLGIAAYTRYVSALNADIVLMFEGGCRSAVLEQYMENLRRLALRERTLQAQKAPTAQARERPSLVQACWAHFGEETRRNSPKWCDCLATGLSDLSTVGERWIALSRDPHSYFTKTTEPPRGGPKDPDWMVYEAANSCRGRR